MERALIGLLIVLQFGVIGCGSGGGSLTQEDLKKRAIRRPKDMDESAAVAVVKTNDMAKSIANPEQTLTSQTIPRSTTPLDKSRSVNENDTVVAPDDSVAVTTNDAGQYNTHVGNVPPVVQAPPKPMTPDECLRFAADNLTQINRAISAYVERNGRFPPPAISVNGRSCLSWRVAVLPLLGHQALFDQFKTDEPWDSKHNRPLLARIPTQFQSPERFDEKTNFVLAIGTTTVFPNSTKGLTPRQIDDGLENTAILVEADNPAAVPWTKPDDLLIDVRNPSKNLGGLRSELFLAGWADGTVSAVSIATPPLKLKSIFTVDAGEPFFAADVQQPIPTSVASMAKASSVPVNTNENNSTAEAQTPSSKPRRTGDSGDDIATASHAGHERLPVPDVAATSASHQLVKSVFGEQFRSAKTLEQKRAVALLMLDHAKKAEKGSAEEYALLRAGWKIAIGIGDFKSVEGFRRLLVGTYAVPDELRLQSQAVRRLSTERLTAAEADQLLTTARNAIDDAVNTDDYEVAHEMREVAERLARRQKDLPVVQELTKLGTTISRLAREHKKVSMTLDSSDPANAPEASSQAGRYFSFYKGQWERGLPLLAEGDDLVTRRLAAKELAASIQASDQIAVADGWWELGVRASAIERENILRHAVSIYQQALTGLEGLTKTKVTMRIDEFHRQFGISAAVK